MQIAAWTFYFQLRGRAESERSCEKRGNRCQVMALSLITRPVSGQLRAALPPPFARASSCGIALYYGCVRDDLDRESLIFSSGTFAAGRFFNRPFIGIARSLPWARRIVIVFGEGMCLTSLETLPACFIFPFRVIV